MNKKADSHYITVPFSRTWLFKGLNVLNLFVNTVRLSPVGPLHYRHNVHHGAKRPNVCSVINTQAINTHTHTHTLSSSDPKPVILPNLAYHASRLAKTVKQWAHLYRGQEHHLPCGNDYNERCVKKPTYNNAFVYCACVCV